MALRKKKTVPSNTPNIFGKRFFQLRTLRSSRVRWNIILQRRSIACSLAYYLERFKLLIGMASLGAATVILVLSNRKRSGRQGEDMFLRLIPLILASVFSFSFLGKPSDEKAARH